MNKIFHLTNPDNRIVKSAWISETEMGATLNVDCWRTGSEILGYRTLRGAKQAFGSNFQKGGKWEQR